MIDLRPSTLLDATSEKYEPPNAEELDAVMRHLGWTSEKMAARLGISQKTVYRWLMSHSIPYATWQLLLLLAGIKVIQTSALHGRVCAIPCPYREVRLHG